MTIIKTQIPRDNRNLGGWAAWLFLAALIVGVGFLSNIQEPLIDHYYFRQTQTALTAYWFNWENPFLDSFFNYRTPIFGGSWQVPFELPLYQVIVSAVACLTGSPIHVVGRLISLSFFLLTLIPLWSLARGLGLGRRFFFITTIFWMCSPLYLYWSRTVMIESTAVFFGFVFLAALERAFACQKQNWCWAFAFAASLACALVKVTTYPAFGLAALGVFAWKTDLVVYLRVADKEKFRALLPPFLGIAFIGIATIAATSAWTHHADSIKMENSLSLFLTSNNLESWNFGTLAQKTSIQNWKQLFNRSITEAIGAHWVMAFLLVAGCFQTGKKMALFVGLLILYLIPMAIFTNLHLVHSYYQYASSFWLVLALGLMVAEMSKRAPLILTGVSVLTITAAQLHTYFKEYYPATRLQTAGALELGGYISANSDKNQSILVIGDDWSPEVAFHSGRRAVYIPPWLSEKQAVVTFEKIRNNPETVFGSNSPVYIVLKTSGITRYPPALRHEIDQLLGDLGNTELSQKTSLFGYILLRTMMDKNGLRILSDQSIKPEIDGERVLGAQSVKPKINFSRTKELFDSITMKKLGNQFDVKLEPDGIFIHPGWQPTEVVFQIGGQCQIINLVAFIAELPNSVLADPLAGTAGVELFVDGKSQGHLSVDRLTNQSYSLDLTQAKELKVVVDCANESANWDHFRIGIAQEAKTH